MVAISPRGTTGDNLPARGGAPLGPFGTAVPLTPEQLSLYEANLGLIIWGASHARDISPLIRRRLRGLFASR